MRWANIRFLSNYQESKNTRTGRLSRNYTWTRNSLAGAISWCRCTKMGSSPRCLKRRVFWWLPTKPAQWSCFPFTCGLLVCICLYWTSNVNHHDCLHFLHFLSFQINLISYVPFTRMPDHLPSIEGLEYIATMELALIEYIIDSKLVAFHRHYSYMCSICGNFSIMLAFIDIYIYFFYKHMKDMYVH